MAKFFEDPAKQSEKEWLYHKHFHVQRVIISDLSLSIMLLVGIGWISWSTLIEDPHQKKKLFLVLEP